MIAARTSLVVVFLFIAFGLAYILGFGYFAAGGALASPKFLLLGIAYMFTPAVAAAVTQRFFARAPWRDLGLTAPPWKILLCAWLAPLLLVFVALALSVLQPGVTLQTGLTALYQQLGDKLPPEKLAQLHQQLDHSALAHPGVLPLLMLAEVLGASATINAVAAFGGRTRLARFLVEPTGAARFLARVIFDRRHGVCGICRSSPTATITRDIRSPARS